MKKRKQMILTLKSFALWKALKDGKISQSEYNVKESIVLARQKRVYNNLKKG